MRRKNIERILITTIIFCALLIIGILGYVFIHKEPDLPKEVFVLPYVDKGDIEIKPVWEEMPIWKKRNFAFVVEKK